MPYIKDPDHYTRGVGAIASLDHNRGRRNARALIARQTLVMDRRKLSNRALGATREERGQGGGQAGTQPGGGAGGGGGGYGGGGGGGYGVPPRPSFVPGGGFPAPTPGRPGTKLPPGRGRDGGKYVGTDPAPQPTTVPPDPNQVVVDPGPQGKGGGGRGRGIVLTGGSSGGGGGGGGSIVVPTAPMPPDVPPAFDPGTDVEQILTPDDPGSTAPAPSSDNTKWLVIGAAGLGALFLLFRKE